jgi:hypothetical protein
VIRPSFKVIGVLAARGESPDAAPPFDVAQGVLSAPKDEGGEAPRWQGATTENIEHI